MAHGEVYAAEFGWDTTFEALVAQIVAEYAADHDPAREAAWIAELDGRRTGCVFCVTAGDQAGATGATAKRRTQDWAPQDYKSIERGAAYLRDAMTAYTRIRLS